MRPPASPSCRLYEPEAVAAIGAYAPEGSGNGEEKGVRSLILTIYFSLILFVKLKDLTPFSLISIIIITIEPIMDSGRTLPLSAQFSPDRPKAPR
jgi:hypothetical protein